ncbi:hypothetical protein P167DRAFT_540632 [Morchella conica CCBAS932]|uniref:Uncharacterized protein n=1 Tax=Morchella conica CCBAS932 TaxID=1392247 RepID=A0A3N4K841_9PEZI|nr:hypothetical protein P167DRAFT_540632 [Morchella conica CCBAS932]
MLAFRRSLRLFSDLYSLYFTSREHEDDLQHPARHDTELGIFRMEDLLRPPPAPGEMVL